MPRPAVKETFIYAGIVLTALCWFLLGINWGLPTRASDAVLFGERTPWTGQEILDLAGGFEQSRKVGADVDLTPAEKDGVLNATDAQRAQIVRRYRLFTQQPDEWNTLRSLATMRPRELDFDPKLYQYGGLWIYGVGGLLGAGHVTGMLTLTSDLAWYLDRPEEFGKLYIAARLWVVLWAAGGAAVMCWIMRRLTGSNWLGLLAAAGWCLMPVVVYASREAKPHLPSAVCMFIAIGLAMRYWDKPTWKRAAAVGLACGGAVGFVLSGAVAIIIPPVMAIFSSVGWGLRLRHSVVGVVTMFGVYIVTNPYAVAGLLTGDGAFTSNVGTTVGMYEGNVTTIERWSAGAMTGLSFMLWQAATPGVLVAGVVGTWYFARLKEYRPTFVLLLITSLAVVVPYLLAASGKPAEHARFALFADVALLVPTLLLLRGPPTNKAIALAALAYMALLGGEYQRAYAMDDGRVLLLNGDDSKLGKQLDGGLAALANDKTELRTAFEPAPWSMPPVDLWHWTIRLHDGSPYQRIGASGNEVSVRPVDAWPTPMSWAGKHMDVQSWP